MKNEQTKILNTWQLFLIISILNLLIVFLNTKLIETKEVFYNTYLEQVGSQEIEKHFKFIKEWQWLRFSLVPVFILIRICLVAICLSVGVFFYNIENTIKFKYFFRTALISEFIIILVAYVKFSFFFLKKGDYSLNDIQQYYPLSYINFLDIEKIQPWLVYPLQTINLFEIAYFFILTIGIWKLLKNNFSKSLEITAVSYGSGLLIWLGIVMFLTLNMT